MNDQTQHICITESLCRRAEINTTLLINYVSIKYILKRGVHCPNRRQQMSSDPDLGYIGLEELMNQFSFRMEGGRRLREERGYDKGESRNTRRQGPKQHSDATPHQRAVGTTAVNHLPLPAGQEAEAEPTDI